MWLGTEQRRALGVIGARGPALPFVLKVYLILGETVMPMVTVMALRQPPFTWPAIVRNAKDLLTARFFPSLRMTDCFAPKACALL